ncbi:hypothetical protein Purlil1_4199 [Purpureocillium lilacinum]|uniref:Uncharacterized protein n=1 Tax=Purpureocillium lilacinum TaxID=33203 RepID=A0ABR0C4P2_PURLI|nr:hypothetical protein Purlil1_4199 [Purpureocillium lilacinum]
MVEPGLDDDDDDDDDDDADSPSVLLRHRAAHTTVQKHAIASTVPYRTVTTQILYGQDNGQERAQKISTQRWGFPTLVVWPLGGLVDWPNLGEQEKDRTPDDEVVQISTPVEKGNGRLPAADDGDDDDDVAGTENSGGSGARRCSDTFWCAALSAAVMGADTRPSPRHLRFPSLRYHRVGRRCTPAVNQPPLVAAAR